MRTFLFALMFMSSTCFAQSAPAPSPFAWIAAAQKILASLIEAEEAEDAAALAARQHCERTKKTDPKARC